MFIFTDSEISHENLTKRSGSEHHSKRPSSSLSLQSSSSKLFVNLNNLLVKKCLILIVMHNRFYFLWSVQYCKHKQRERQPYNPTRQLGWRKGNVKNKKYNIIMNRWIAFNGSCVWILLIFVLWFIIRYIFLHVNIIFHR